MLAVRPMSIRTVVILQVVLLAAVSVLLRWGPAGWAAAMRSLVAADVTTTRLAWPWNDTCSTRRQR